VHLVEVHVIGLKPLETALQRLLHLLANEPRPAPQPRHGVGRAGNLRGQHHLLAAVARAQPVADEGFGAALGLGPGRHRIHLGRIDQVDPALQCVIELLEGFGLGILLAPGHRAQTDQADVDAGSAQRTV